MSNQIAKEIGRALLEGTPQARALAMMDIESNRYRIRSVSGSIHELEDRKAKQKKLVTYTRGASHLAWITEKEFDAEMRQIFESSK